MLTLKTLGPNCHEITDGNTSVLFSYATPVAAHVAGIGFMRTDTHHSVTTSRHVNAYVGGPKAGSVVPEAALVHATLSLDAEALDGAREAKP